MITSSFPGNQERQAVLVHNGTMLAGIDTACPAAACRPAVLLVSLLPCSHDHDWVLETLMCSGYPTVIPRVGGVNTLVTVSQKFT